MSLSAKTKDKSTRRVADICAYVVISVSSLIIIWLLLRIFVCASFSIPSTSMAPTLIPGDRITVVRQSQRRGLFLRPEDLGREDVVVFNFVHKVRWDTIERNPKVFYVKRIAALPGDTFAIDGFSTRVNSTELTRYPPKEELNAFYPSDSIGRAENMRGYMAEREDSVDRWTVRDYGPLIIPAKGMTLPIDSISWRRYRLAIEHETGKKVTLAGASPLLGGKPLCRYTFTKNYYFVLGDNAPGSTDSRYWGLLPEDFIVGRAVFIHWSDIKGEIKWNRILKRIN